MKIIRIIFFALLALVLIVCSVVFILFESFNPDQYLPQITKKASHALGRPISIGQLGLGLSSQGITLDAGPVIMADDVDFTSQPFMTIDKIRISLDLKALVLQRKFYIKKIILQSPQIHFIRSLEGHMNVMSIGHSSPVIENFPSSVIASPKGEAIFNTTTDNNTALTPIKIGIQDASISYIDQNQTIPLDIWLTDINASMNDVSLDPSKRNVQISELILQADMSQLDIKKISNEISDQYIIKHISGVVQLTMFHLNMEASGIISVNGSIGITGGVIKDFNIVKTTLSHTLGSFGGLEGNIDDLLSGPLKSSLGADDTILQKASAQFSYHDKSGFIDDSLIKTNILELTAKGSLDSGLNLDMQTMLHLNTDVSAALIKQIDSLKFLCDDSKRIDIGASLKGVVPDLKYKPNKDFRKKSKKVLIEEGGNILGALLGGGQISDQDQGASSQNTGKKIKKSFKNIFKSLLQ